MDDTSLQYLGFASRDQARTWIRLASRTNHFEPKSVDRCVTRSQRKCEFKNFKKIVVFLAITVSVSQTRCLHTAEMLLFQPGTLSPIGLQSSRTSRPMKRFLRSSLSFVSPTFSAFPRVNRLPEDHFTSGVTRQIDPTGESYLKLMFHFELRSEDSCDI